MGFNRAYRNKQFCSNLLITESFRNQVQYLKFTFADVEVTDSSARRFKRPFWKRWRLLHGRLKVQDVPCKPDSDQSEQHSYSSGVQFKGVVNNYEPQLKPFQEKEQQSHGKPIEDNAPVPEYLFQHVANIRKSENCMNVE